MLSIYNTYKELESKSEKIEKEYNKNNSKLVQCLYQKKKSDYLKTYLYYKILKFAIIFYRKNYSIFTQNNINLEDLYSFCISKVEQILKNYKNYKKATRLTYLIESLKKALWRSIMKNRLKETILNDKFIKETEFNDNISYDIFSNGEIEKKYYIDMKIKKAFLKLLEIVKNGKISFRNWFIFRICQENIYFYLPEEIEFLKNQNFKEEDVKEMLLTANYTLKELKERKKVLAKEYNITIRRINLILNEMRNILRKCF